ncbi:MAG TPA: PVC-type heme-binding CxxCH protein [Planctomycetota bacterium]|nr:PVC-type heme-binding CxxCH protein [Planctomycetota bacterium]
MRYALVSLVLAAATLAAGEYQIPKMPEGLEAKLLISSPQISEVVSCAASADGRKVWIGMQHSACDNGKWGDVKMLYDADGDGTYERVTMFATETGGGQGMLCLDDTLYLVHSPYLTSYRDLDNDGVAEEKKHLLEGLGPAFNGGLHDHTVSGVNPGTDGWLYISVGDKGVVATKGTDGKQVQLYGGGIIRVRPDGTDVEVYCVGLRNTMDVGIDPELNVFMRDNTNDGGGWNVRSTHIWQTGQYGYPNLYKNYVSEMLPCMDDHGGGSPCGCIFYNEPGLREEDRGKLLFCDWGRAIVYRYDLERKGATYVMKQNEWIKNQNPFRAVDIQPDAVGNVYIADWGRGGWGKGAQAGAILKVSAAGHKSGALPKFKELDIDGLVSIFKGPSQTQRLLAQKELLARGEKALPALLKIMEGGEDIPRIQRVFALWTYKQIAKEKAAEALLKLAEKRKDFREQALRAATDRMKENAGVPYEPFVKALKDEDAFVRGQAAVSLGRLGVPPETATWGSENFVGPQPVKYGVEVKNKKQIAEALCQALGDSELQVRHVAMRALRTMGAYEECLATAEKGSDLAAEFALVALREIYVDAAADGLIALYGREKRTPRKVEILKAIGRLAKKEDVWTGHWWGTQPNTVGPFQKFASWSSTEKLVNAIKPALSESDEIVLGALWALKCMRDESSVAEIQKLLEKGSPAVKSEALQALLATRPPQAVPLFGKMLVDSTVSEADRKAALDALAKIKTPAADVAIVEAIPKLEAEFKDPAKKYDKNSGVLPLTRKAMANVKSVETVNALKAIVTSAESATESRTAAAQALSTVPGKEAAEALGSLLNDPNPELVALSLRNVNPKGTLKPAKIREFLNNPDAKIQAAALIALGRMKDFDSAELIATKLKTVSLQAAAVEALKTMGPGGNAALVADVIERILAAVESEEIEETKVEQQAVAAARLWAGSNDLTAEMSSKIQARLGSQGGVIATWHLMGPVFDSQDKSFEIVYDIEKVPPEELPKATMKIKEQTFSWKAFTSTDPNGVISFNQVWSADGSGAAFAYCEVTAPKETKAKLICGSDDSLTVYVNGVRVWNKDYNRGLNPDADTIEMTLKEGKNLILVKVCNHQGGWQLCGRIEGLAKRGGKRTQQRESLIAEAMTKTGNPSKGEALFNDEKRAGCIRCHQVNHKGGNIGPDLSSIGATKERRYLIDSVLEPSKDMAQGFQPMKITYTSGKVAFGVILNETGDTFELATADAKRETIKNADVKSKTPVAQSVMPEGLVDSFTREEFVDLVAYLLSLKK